MHGEDPPPFFRYREDGRIFTYVRTMDRTVVSVPPPLFLLLSLELCQRGPPVGLRYENYPLLFLPGLAKGLTNTPFFPYIPASSVAWYFCNYGLAIEGLPPLPPFSFPLFSQTFGSRDRDSHHPPLPPHLSSFLWSGRREVFPIPFSFLRLESNRDVKPKSFFSFFAQSFRHGRRNNQQVAGNFSLPLFFLDKAS